MRAKITTLGLGLDPWQDGLGRCIVAKRADGLYAAGVGGVVISIPRQVGKTYLVGAIVFALCLLHPGLLVIWTAHRKKTAEETFGSMQVMAKRRKVAAHIEKITVGSGDEAVVFTNGSRILFGARETGFGLGFAKVGMLILDEAQRLTEKTLDDLVPTMNAAENPLLFMMGTPPRPTDDGEVFSQRRTDALSGEERDTLFLEISADPDTDARKWAPGHIDWSAIEVANPSYPARTNRAAIMRMRKMLTPDSFNREALGLWGEATARKRPISGRGWDDLVGEWSEGRVAYGVKFTLDGERLCLAAATELGDGKVFVEAFEPARSPSGIEPLAEWLEPRVRGGSTVWVDGKSGSGLLLEDLHKRRLPSRRVVSPTVDQVVTAHSAFLARVEKKALVHPGQPGMGEAVRSAGRRRIGVRGGWGWEQVGDGDILPLEAVTLAVSALDAKATPGVGGRETTGRTYVTR